MSAKKESYTTAFKRVFNDSQVKEDGIIKRLSSENVEQRLVIASSDESLEAIKCDVYLEE